MRSSGGGSAATLQQLLQEAEILARHGSFEEAARRYRIALRQCADARQAANVHHNLGVVLQRLGHHAQAVRSFRDSLGAGGDDAGALLNAGVSLHALGRYEEALDCDVRVLRLGEHAAQAHNNAGNALQALERRDEALEHFRDAVAADPGFTVAWDSLGNALKSAGRLGEAIDAYRGGLARGAEDERLFSNYLLALNYSEDCSAEQLYLEHRRFGERFSAGYTAPVPDRTWPRRLRVGYVSPDFRSHSVASFIEPVLERHDRQAFEVFCYYTHDKADAVTARLRRLAGHWVECAGMSAAELAQRVRLDRIDILVDLAGHTGEGRLLAFAEKPAPLQMSYLGYPNTTGLEAIDYRITDARADPPGSERHSVERLLRPWPTYFCYRPAEGARQPGRGRDEGAPLIFGSFNNLPKISDAFLAAAARVLAQVPHARLRLKSRGLEEPRVRGMVQERMTRASLDPARVDFLGWIQDAKSHVAQYDAVDIGLDTFPYGGGTTTCEALWSGVPVVTLGGDRHAGRMGASLLHAVGLGDLVAGNVDQYVETAVALARDAVRLRDLRSGMRGRVASSPLMDHAGFTRALEAAYIEAWREKLAML